MTSNQGRIITASISSIKNLECNEVWQITRSGREIPGTTRVPQLAPSPGLFKKYLNEWKGKSPELWWPQYVERFTGEMKREECVNTLRSLWKAVQAGKSIALVCFCKSPIYCHRTLVGNFLRQHHIEVIEYEQPGTGGEVPQDDNHMQFEQPSIFGREEGPL